MTGFKQPRKDHWALRRDRAQLRLVEAERDELLAALKPFADAAADLDEHHPGFAHILESAAAMSISAGDLREAASKFSHFNTGSPPTCLTSP